MSDPTPQKMAEWAIDIAEDDWKRLDELCAIAVKGNNLKFSEDYIASLISNKIEHVSDILKELSAEAAMQGQAILFEIDDETPPYIRAKDRDHFLILKRLRKVDPKVFEHICAGILEQFGAQGKVTGQSNDHGVDFIGSKLAITGNDFPNPQSTQVFVVGQAKRYADKPISESELRKFIGGATRRVHQLKKGGEIGALTPIIYAFWTSADFEKNAKFYADEVGLWLMNGVTMSIYLSKLKLLHYLPPE